MNRRTNSAIPITMFVLATSLIGCGSSDSGRASESPDMQKMKAELAKLSPEEAGSAAKQQRCPVSGEMLGTMGAPKKVDLTGTTVWICCDGCREELSANPEKYLATLTKE